MAFGYHFVDLTDAQKHERRVLLDRYALIALISATVPFVVLQCAYHVSRLRQRWISQDDLQPPGSPHLKDNRGRISGGWNVTLGSWRWWLDDEVIVVCTSLGSKGQVLAGGLWTAWLLWLCFVQTGPDYLHLTKRFGIVAASQMPVHYLLSSRSILKSSSQTFNSYHQLLGRIITFLLCLHAAFYLNFYIQNNLLASKLQEPYVLCGIGGIIALTAIGTTSLAPTRRWSYRVFYITHITLATALLPLLFFHVIHIRIYLYESAAIYALNIALRILTTTNVSATLTPIPNTNLLEITIPLSNNPFPRLRRYQPAQYAYISLPGHPASRTIRSNPFTLASLPTLDKNLRFYARVLNGNTANLYLHCGPQSLAIEGPLGPSTRADTLLRHDRILFVAGGVGATFIVPLYRQLLSDLSPSAGSTRRQRVKFVWVARTREDVGWAFPSREDVERDGFVERLSVFITGNLRAGYSIAGDGDEDDEAIELAERKDLLSADERAEKGVGSKQFDHDVGRPDLRRMVDEAFSHGSSERVAVVVCGPKSLSRELREEVGKYVRHGRQVWFWEEVFGL